MGKLFVIDGTDGSGKQTQFLKLKNRLDAEGIKYMNISFPNYESDSSALVKMYLAGDFGENASDVSPYIASTFYAADRYATYKKKLEKFYETGGLILADRYTSSNMIHQSGKIKDKKERKKFINWLFDLEFNLYKIPKPDRVFFLNMPTQVSLELIKNRENKITHEMKKDIHERDEHHLLDAYNAACDLAKEYDWFEIKCTNENGIRTVDDIHEEIFAEVKRILDEE